MTPRRSIAAPKGLTIEMHSFPQNCRSNVHDISKRARGEYSCTDFASTIFIATTSHTRGIPTVAGDQERFLSEHICSDRIWDIPR